MRLSLILGLLFVFGLATSCAHPTLSLPATSTSAGGARVWAHTETTVGFAPLADAGAKHDVRGLYYFIRGRGVSRICMPGHDSLWFCAEDRWLAGENRHRSVYVPHDASFLVGTDLGRSVRFGASGRTFFYMGDSFGSPDEAVCGARNPLFSCNDAILAVDGPSSRGNVGDGVPRDFDPADGIDTAVAVSLTSSGRARGFFPVVIDGVNGRDALPLCDDTQGEDSACLGKFSVPTGVVAAKVPASLVSEIGGDVTAEVDAVLMLFGTATAVRKAERSPRARLRGSSFLAVSLDGLHFSLINRQPFSRGKFIIAAMTLLKSAVRQRVCESDPQGPLCDPALGLDGDAVILLGVGQPPRRSPLHLAVLRLSDLKVFYYRFDPGSGIESWSNQEEDATPVIEAHFGETGLSLITKDMCPVEARQTCEDTLLLLANQDGGVNLRYAPLSRPGARSAHSADLRSWSEPLRTSAAGYGPFVVDDYTRVVSDGHGGLLLEMTHVISSWDGKGPRQMDRNPYGVFTRPLRLVDESTCRPASDESGIPICEESVPRWPLNHK